MTTAACPECGVEISFAEVPMPGEIIECSACGVELEVIAVDPVTLELAPEIEEDWGE